MSPPVLLAQLTDSHIRPPGLVFADVVDTLGMLRAGIDAVLAQRPLPDAVLLSGDLTNDGEPEAYALIRPELARLPMPVYAVPGNHDDREAMRELAAVAEIGAAAPFRQFTADFGALRLIGLDSLVPGEPHGELCTQRLDWLAAALDAAADRPVLLMVHHPPPATGIGFMDRIGLRSSPALDALIRRHAGHLERIVSGHVHRPVFYRWHGVPVSIGPGVAHHVTLALDEREPTFALEPPGYHLHRWTAAEGLVTHQVPIGDFPGPYRFSGNPGATSAD